MVGSIFSTYSESSKESGLDFVYSDSNIEFLDNIEDFISDVDFIRNESKVDLAKERKKLFDHISGLFDENRHETNFSSPYKVNAPDASAEAFADRVFYAIRNSSFEEGQLSAADIELEKILNDKGKEFLLNVFTLLWNRCFASNYLAFAHFLNCVQNISYFVSSDEFVVYACTAIAHKNLVVREAGVALFEQWDDPKYIHTLENIADTGVDWLDSYKREVIEGLRR